MLLERGELLKDLQDLLSKAKDGAGCLVLIGGEAGAGKTSLVNAFVAAIDSDVLLMSGNCDPLSTPRPLSPLLDFASNHETGIADLLAGDSDNLEIFHEIRDRVRHSRRPVLMVIEDVHWADQATLDFLRFIGRRVADMKAMVVLTYRDDEVGPDHPLRTVLGQLIPLASTARLRVPALSPEAVERLASQSGFDPAQLHRLTGGNAFFVTEMIAGGSKTPSTVQDAVVARLARLTDGARQVAEAVSVAPRSLDVERALLLAGGKTNDVDAAVSSGVIQSDGRELRFRHELARSAVEASIPPARRHSLHQRMIALLQEEDPTDHARLAHHATRSRQPDLIAEHAPIAAEEAASRSAHKEAISFYEAAFEVADLLDPARVAEMRISASEELRIVDRHTEAVAAAETAAEYFREHGPTEMLSRALSREGSARWASLDRSRARENADEAVSLLEPLGPSIDLAYAQSMSAHFHMLARHAEPATRAVEKSLETARAIEDDEAIWRSELTRATIHVVAGEGREGMKQLVSLLERSRETDNKRQEAIALGMLGSGGGEIRTYSEAQKYLDESVEQGLATDEDYSVAYSRAWQARIAFEQGQWERAVEMAELVSRTAPADTGIAVVTALGALGRVRVRRGDPGGADLLGDIAEIQDTHEIQHVWSPLCGLAEYHWLHGDNDLAAGILSHSFDRALDTDSEWARGEVGYWMWKVGVIDGPPDNAALPFRLQMEGNWMQAAEEWRSIGCPYEVGLAMVESGETGSMMDALEIFDSLGAKPMSDLVRARLREAGVDSVPRPPSRSTMRNPANLTNRQLEVLELLARGLTNGDIAQELFISKKTVEHHVSAIFSKLGVETREQAAKKAIALR